MNINYRISLLLTLALVFMPHKIHTGDVVNSFLKYTTAAIVIGAIGYVGYQKFGPTGEDRFRAANTQYDESNAQYAQILKNFSGGNMPAIIEDLTQMGSSRELPALQNALAKINQSSYFSPQARERTPLLRGVAFVDSDATDLTQSQEDIKALTKNDSQYQQYLLLSKLACTLKDMSAGVKQNDAYIKNKAQFEEYRSQQLAALSAANRSKQQPV